MAIATPCADGFYCFSDTSPSGFGAMTTKPNNPVSISANAAGENGGICVPGYFCKSSFNGGNTMDDCSPGQYCANFGLGDTEG